MDHHPDPAPAAPAPAWPALRVARRVLVVVLLVAAGGLALLGGLPEVCRDALAAGTTVRVCEPMAATDPRVLLFLLVVGLLLLPELSELELAGVLTLRRRIDEARTEVAEVKGEVAQLRAQASASVQAGLRNQLHVSIGARSAEVARAVSFSAGAGGGSPPESLGAYAQFAFEAGLAGLVPLMPDWAAPALLLGYTVGDEGRLVPTYVAGTSSPPLDAIAATITPTAPRVVVSTLDECWAAVAPARDDDGGAVGAVAVLVPRDSVHRSGAPEQLPRELAVWAEIVAGAYARLLIDVLCEQPRPGVLAK